MNWKQAAAGIVVLCLLLTGLASPAAAASKVKVTIPKFAVKLNGKKIDSAHSLYPPLLYKDITYFPMTVEYGKALGLDIRWDKKTGLSIQSGLPRQPWKEYNTGSNSLTSSYTASIATFPIEVNGVKIDNAKEAYPLLLFRDITYFPMTWRFTHDFFGWETSWNAQTGYKIISSQRPVLESILSDDADSLYVRGTQGIFKIGKKLDGTFSRLSEDETRNLYGKLEQEAQNHALPAGEDVRERLAEQDHDLYFGSHKLLSLTPYLEEIAEYVGRNPRETDEAGMTYYANLMKLDDDLSLLEVSVYYLTNIPAPYTPHEVHIFVIHQDKVSKIEGFSQYPQQLIRNPDGSYWLAKAAIPSEELTARNYDEAQGLLALIRKDGSAVLINKQLSALDIDLLRVNDQGTAILKAYNDRVYEELSIGKDGIYTVDTSLNAKKLIDAIRGKAYVDQNGDIFTLTPQSNTVNNVSMKKSWRWMDYELLAE